MERLSRSVMCRFNLKDFVIQLQRIDENDLILEESSSSEVDQQNQPNREPLPHSELSGFPCKFCSRTFRALPELYSHTYRLHRDVRLRQQMKIQRAKCETSVTRPKMNNSEASHEISKTETDRPEITRLMHMETSTVKNAQRKKRDLSLRSRSMKKFTNYKKSDHGHRNLKRDVIPASSRPRKKSKKSGRVLGPKICMFCGKQFKKNSKLVEHMVVHTKEKPFQCKICNTSFSFRASLMGHIKKVHTDKDVQCPNCKLRFPNRKTMEAHAEENHRTAFQKRPVVHCEPVFITADLQSKHFKTHGQVFNCKYCDGMFTKKCSLSLHVRSQHKNLMFHCTQCFRYIEFARIGPHMDYHKRKLANGAQVLNCKVCRRQFDSARSLDVHFEKQHSSELNVLKLSNNRSEELIEPQVPQPSLPLPCPDSSREVHSTADVHVQVPSKPNPATTEVPKHKKNFQCSICSMTFNFKSRLDYHMKLHSSRMGKYKCSECEISFVSHTHLMRHQAEKHLHIEMPEANSNSNECKICGNVFPTGATFLKHLFKQHAKNITGQSTPAVGSHGNNTQASIQIQRLNSQTSARSAKVSMDKQKRHTVIKEYKCDKVVCHGSCTCVTKGGVSLQEQKEYNEIVRDRPVQLQYQAPPSTPRVHTDPNWNEILRNALTVQVNQRQNTHVTNMPHPHVSTHPSTVLRSTKPKTPQLPVVPHRSETIRYQNPVHVGQSPQLSSTHPPHRNEVIQSVTPLLIEHRTSTSSTHQSNSSQPLVVCSTYLKELVQRLNPVQTEHRAQNSTAHQHGSPQIQLGPNTYEVFQSANLVQIEPQAQVVTPDCSTSHSQSQLVGPDRDRNVVFLLSNDVQIEHRTQTSIPNCSIVIPQSSPQQNEELQATNTVVQYQAPSSSTYCYKTQLPQIIDPNRSVVLRTVNSTQLAHQRTNPMQLEIVNPVEPEPSELSLNAVQFQFQIVHPVQPNHQGAANPGQFQHQTTSPARLEYQRANPVQSENQRANSMQSENQRTNLVQSENQRANPAQFQHQRANYVPQSQRANPVQIQLQIVNPLQLDLQRASAATLEHKRASNFEQIQNQAKTLSPCISPLHSLPNENQNQRRVNSVQTQGSTIPSSTPCILCINGEDCDMVVSNMNQLVRHRIVEKSKLYSDQNFPKKLKFQDLPKGKDIIGRLSVSAIISCDSLDDS